ncbi:MAG: hypothetical protein NT139_00485 [Candidatus Woesearchaeota archaeon]|nr:hypothetical protein [Candidatus Woesearchaeota archaeon]
MKKKGDIWVSAVLYLALGVIVLIIILNAGVPLIKNMTQRNIVSQTKDMMFTLDKNIRTIINEGPNSRRVLNPFTIDEGNLYVNETDITWEMETSDKMMEPNILINEGVLKIILKSTKQVDKYLIDLNLNYKDITKLELVSSSTGPFSGKYNLIVTHSGRYDNNIPIVTFNIM